MNLNNCTLSSSEIISNTKSNFFPSFILLSKEKRYALSVIYAYARFTDDLVDLEKDPQIAKSNIQYWHLQVLQLNTKKDRLPLLQEVYDVIHTYKIPLIYPIKLSKGVLMDINQTQYTSFQDLYIYCYHVSCVIGLMVIHLLGLKNVISHQYAIKLGLAFQLTNIVRDIKEDAMRGKFYIPQQDIKQFGISLAQYKEIFLQFNENQKLSPSIKNLINFEINRIEEYHHQAKQCFEQLSIPDQKKLLIAESMQYIYKGLMKKMKKILTYYNDLSK